MEINMNSLNKIIHFLTTKENRFKEVKLQLQKNILELVNLKPFIPIILRWYTKSATSAASPPAENPQPLPRTVRYHRPDLGTKY